MATVCVAPALIIFVYHKTREEAGALNHINEDGTNFICSVTVKNIPISLCTEGGFRGGREGG